MKVNPVNVTDNISIGSGCPPLVIAGPCAMESYEIISETFLKLRELSKKQASTSTLLRKVDYERERILKVVKRGEKIVKFFDEKTPYSDVLKEMETKKYDDCRSLLSQGMNSDQIATELGISKSEIEIISSLS